MNATDAPKHLCLFSTSKTFAGRVLRACPLSLTMAEYGDCPHRQTQSVCGGEAEKPVRVTACQAPAPEQPQPTIPGVNQMTTPATAPKPLWPQPLPVVGCTGEYKAGKTLFVLIIDPAHTLYFDTEKSGETYEALGLGFTRIDVWREMLRLYPHGHRPIDLFQWWLDQVKAIQPGRHRVIALDTVSEIESGLCDWVHKNPGHFGHTAAQYLKMQGVYWGDVKEYWKAILADLASRCDTFAFTAHMGDIWGKGDNSGPTGKRKPKGKSTLMELASLYLQLERKPGKDGTEPAKPSANVLKSRLVSGRAGADGELELLPTLPPRLPVATPAAIRQYMLSPAGGREATEDEKVHEAKLTEEERLRLLAQIAEANRDAEQAQLERVSRQSEAKAARPGAASKPSPAPAASHPAGVNGAVSAVIPVRLAASSTAQPSQPAPASPAQPANLLTDEQIGTLAGLKADLAIDNDSWRKLLDAYQVSTARALTTDQAADLITKLKRQSLGDYLTAPADPAFQTQPKLTQDQINRLVELKAGLQEHGLTADQWPALLAAYQVTTAKDLSERQANDLIARLTVALHEAEKGGAGADAALSKNAG